MSELILPKEFLWMEFGIAAAVILQTLEFLQIRASFGKNGIWSWAVLRREFQDLPGFLRSVLDFSLGDRGFPRLLIARLLGAVGVLLWSHWALWAFLFFSTVLICLRWRGTFNGGSDYMSLIVLACVTAGHVFGGMDPRWIQVALGYVGIQTCLSFFIAGLAKVRHPKWRSGKALEGFLASDYYGTPNRYQRAFNDPAFPFVLLCSSWGIILFELLFPVVLVDPRICQWGIALAVVFQLANAWFFGLNRFVWAWASAYPALYWCSLYFENLR